MVTVRVLEEEIAVPVSLSAVKYHAVVGEEIVTQTVQVVQHLPHVQMGFVMRAKIVLPVQPIVVHVLPVLVPTMHVITVSLVLHVLKIVVIVTNRPHRHHLLKV